MGYTSSVYYLEYAEPKPKNLSFSFKAGRGRGRDAKNWKVFGFWTRVKRAPRGALVRITIRAERMIRVRATTRSARTKHAINRFAIENRFELGSKYTPTQNRGAPSEPNGGTREVRPSDFPPFLQDNLARCLRQRAGFFRKGGGSTSEAILIHTICLIQK
ncbi:MAG: hypothetical protein COU72_00590 [Parcubacteria group bacterium CG10_big_fil_rev_8_21_14_0_10_41_35]|nr:MAG: hypothetical protein COU72_00590 [Parcubacteria group bacterium CG10_big_fil_rev_8_21_14_0_10_41_35]